MNPRSASSACSGPGRVGYTPRCWPLSSGEVRAPSSWTCSSTSPAPMKTTWRSQKRFERRATLCWRLTARSPQTVPTRLSSGWSRSRSLPAPPPRWGQSASNATPTVSFAGCRGRSTGGPCSASPPHSGVPGSSRRRTRDDRLVHSGASRQGIVTVSYYQALQAGLLPAGFPRQDRSRRAFTSAQPRSQPDHFRRQLRC